MPHRVNRQLAVHQITVRVGLVLPEDVDEATARERIGERLEALACVEDSEFVAIEATSELERGFRLSEKCPDLAQLFHGILEETGWIELEPVATDGERELTDERTPMGSAADRGR